MTVQRIRSDFWEARLPEGWTRLERTPKEVVHFEAPNHTAGIYLATWRITGQTLLSSRAQYP